VFRGETALPRRKSEAPAEGIAEASQDTCLGPSYRHIECRRDSPMLQTHLFHNMDERKAWSGKHKKAPVGVALPLGLAGDVTGHQMPVTCDGESVDEVDEVFDKMRIIVCQYGMHWRQDADLPCREYTCDPLRREGV
jgi:hypothetical protein